MTNLEAANLLDNLIGMVSDNHDSDYDEALSKGRDILKSEPCDDCVSREAAIDAVKKNTSRLTFAEEQDCEGHVLWSAKAVPSDAIEGALLELPPVTPQPKTGWWEDDAEYERGLEDAWKVAREVIIMDSTQQFEIFGEHGDINVLNFKSAREAVKLYEENKEKQKTLEQDRACSILDDNCPYPHLGCYECEVHCVMERANKKLEERNYMP